MEAGPELAHPYLELLLTDPRGMGRSQPFFSSEITLTVAEGERWSALVGEHSVLLQQLEGSLPGIFYGQPTDRAELKPGESLEVGQQRVWVTDARLPPLASLEGYSHGYEGRVWSLRAQPYQVGRRGAQRLNQVELNHPTVSRGHATLLPDGASGRVLLLCETDSSLTAVNGRPLQAGEAIGLRHGDLLHLGELSLRFRSAAGPVGDQRLALQCLGGFRVEWGALHLTEVDFKAEKARWLLARLGWAWGASVATEELMETLWPDLPPLRGRKNLSQCLVSLKAALQLEEGADLFDRTPASLALNPELLGSHDARDLEALLDSSLPAAWQKALSLYGGEYLPGCYDDWAVRVRERLTVAMGRAALRLARHHSLSGQPQAAADAAARGSELDRCDQEAALLQVEALLQLGQPQQAWKVLEATRRALREQLDALPCRELIQAEQLVRSAL